MSSNSNNFGMPKQTLIPLAPGATSIRDSGIVTQNINSKMQNTLINGTTKGGRRIKTKLTKGGAATITVQPVPANGLQNTAAQQNYTALTTAAAVQNRQAAYDGLVGQPQAATAVVAAKQAALSGGKRTKTRTRTRTRKYYGGKLVWGCLSGGKHKRKSRKNSRTRKSRH